MYRIRFLIAPCESQEADATSYLDRSKEYVQAATPSSPKHHDVYEYHTLWYQPEPYFIFGFDPWRGFERSNPVRPPHARQHVIL